MDVEAFARFCLNPFAVHVRLVMEDLGMIKLSKINACFSRDTKRNNEVNCTLKGS